ncbi:MAG: TetR/AcrR family transcriptional regulator, partial [Propionibacteriaceae bacterium]
MGTLKDGSTEQGRASRDAILDAALAEFTLHGYSKSSLSGIAKRAKISKSGLLHHFSDKSQLLTAVLSERTDVSRHPDQDRSVTGTLQRFELTAEINQSDRNWVRFFSIMVAESLTQDHPAFPVIEARYRGLLSQRSEELQSEYPGLDPAVADHVACLAVAALDGLQIQQALFADFEMSQAYHAFVEMA